MKEEQDTKIIGGEVVKRESTGRLVLKELRHAVRAMEEAAERNRRMLEAQVARLRVRGTREVVVDGRRYSLGGRVYPHPIGDGAFLTFDMFMERLRPVMEPLLPWLLVVDNRTWTKVESLRSGHRVYISRGKLAVGRVETTLEPELVPGSLRPPRPNGLIRSFLPADTGAVGQAIRIMCEPSRGRK